MSSNDPYQQIWFWEELKELYRKKICEQQKESGECSYLKEKDDTRDIRHTGRTDSSESQLSEHTGTESGT